MFKKTFSTTSFPEPSCRLWKVVQSSENDRRYRVTTQLPQAPFFVPTLTTELNPWNLTWKQTNSQLFCKHEETLLVNTPSKISVMVYRSVLLLGDEIISWEYIYATLWKQLVHNLENSFNKLPTMIVFKISVGLTSIITTLLFLQFARPVLSSCNI